MHDGSLATLEDVVKFYDEGGRPNPNLDPEIHALHLTAEEKQALVAFLQSLSGSIREGQPLAVARAHKSSQRRNASSIFQSKDIA